MIRKMLGAALIVLTLLTTLPAAAAPAAQITICNHTGSVDRLYVYNNQTGYNSYVNIGVCRNGVDDTSGMARVDVDVGNSLGDVDAWYKVNLTHGSSGDFDCHNNEEEASNPYSGTYGETTLYHTFSHTGC